jgi:hypothetical protein
MEIVLLAIGLVGFAFLALGVGIFFRKDGKFPETEVGKNKNMRQLGIYCTKCEEGKKWREAKRKEAARNIKPNNLKIDIAGLGEQGPTC